MDRASLLADRDPCKHGRQEPHDYCTTHDDPHAWHLALVDAQEHGCSTELCPGGAAKFTECGTCGGSGVVDSPAPMGVPDAYEIEYNPGMTEPCPDCVLGLQGHNGWRLEWHHENGHIAQHVRIRYQGYPSCKAFECGWVAVSEVIVGLAADPGHRI